MDILKQFLGTVPPWLLLFSGAALGWLRSFWNEIYSHTIGWASKKVQVELTVEEQDFKDIFLWINLWVEGHLRKKKISSLRIEKKYSEGTKSRELYDLVPGYGTYYFFWKKKLVVFTSTKKEVGGEADYDTGKLVRTVGLTVWGTRDREILTEILLEAKELFETSHPKSLKYYTHDATYWDDHKMEKRSIDTLYLPEEQLSDILQSFQNFFNSEKIYRSLGIPWRFSFLFEGAPGTGKSSLAQVLACHFGVRLYYINLTSISASALQTLLSNVVSPCILLMEDVDCVSAATAREDNKDSKSKKSEDQNLGIRTNELLNILDGLIATENRIVIMTTNYPEKLDAAILRPGRVDRRFHIGYAKDTELRRFYDNAVKHFSLPSFEEFRKRLPENCTIADAQGKIFEIQSEQDRKGLNASE